MEQLRSIIPGRGSRGLRLARLAAPQRLKEANRRGCGNIQRFTAIAHRDVQLQINRGRYGRPHTSPFVAKNPGQRLSQTGAVDAA